MIYPEGDMTVIHFQPATGRWEVEETDDHVIWTTDEATASSLAGEYNEEGWTAVVVPGDRVAGVVVHDDPRGPMLLPLGTTPRDLG